MYRYGSCALCGSYPIEVLAGDPPYAMRGRGEISKDAPKKNHLGQLICPWDTEPYPIRVGGRYGERF